MKLYKYLILSMIATSSLTSCLDEKPLYSQNNNLSSENSAELALLGCYSYMASVDCYGQFSQEIPICASGFTWAQRSGNDGIVSLQALSSDELISSTWKGLYKVISESNAYLENLEKSDLNEAAKTQFGGEAKFLRAVAYYNLVALWGDVPLKTTASTSGDISTPRSPKEKVLEQVVKDLTDALSIHETSEDGRANSWAAKAFLGKVYYKMAKLGINTSENLKNAKNMFDDVYSHHRYQLEKNYADLFGEWVTNSKESIFQLNFSLNSPSSFNRASNRFSPTGSTPGVTWSTYLATKASYDLHWGSYPNDPRIAATFLTSHRDRGGNNKPNPKAQVGDTPSANDSVYYYPYLTYTVQTGIKMVDGKEVAVYDSIYKGGKAVAVKQYVTRLPYETFADMKNPDLNYLDNLDETAGSTPQEKAQIKALKNVRSKFAESGNQMAWPAHMKLYDPNQQGTSSHKNLMVYRYAEMLLLMADVYNELDDTQKAISLVEEVLSRARTSKGGNGIEPKAWPTNLTKEQVSEKIYFEFLFELNGEPSIYDLLRIKGTEYLKKALQYHNNHEITKASDAFYKTSSQKWSDRVYNDGNLTEEFLKKNLLLPIPDTERDANPGITDNNYGY